jgi:excisionase family DNA binding protein
MSVHILLDTVETARLLGLHPDTLRTWRMQGRGPSWVRLGNRYRYTEEALEAFLRASAEVQQDATL